MTETAPAGDDEATIWQAEGVLMELFNLGSTEAGNALRWRARIDNRSVVDTAAAILSRAIANE